MPCLPCCARRRCGRLALARRRGTRRVVAGAARRDRPLRRRDDDRARLAPRRSSPQYPLWSDGAAKRRWIRLPPGTAIDASRPDALGVPARHAAVEGVRASARPRRDALHRAPARTARGASRPTCGTRTAPTRVLAPAARHARVARDGAPGGRYDMPVARRLPRVPRRRGRAGARLLRAAAVAGPRSARAARASAARRSTSTSRARATRTRARPARGAARDAAAHRGRSPAERAALGYLHGNCGHCHNDAGALGGLDLALAQQAAADPRAARGDRSPRSSGTRAASARTTPTPRSASCAGSAETRAVARMRSRNPLARMPPLGIAGRRRRGRRRSSSGGSATTSPTRTTMETHAMKPTSRTASLVLATMALASLAAVDARSASPRPRRRRTAATAKSDAAAEKVARGKYLVTRRPCATTATRRGRWARTAPSPT